MNFVSRVTLFVLPSVLLLGLPAQAQEVEIGTSLICDTQQQVERYVTLYDGDEESTIKNVNAAEHDPTACAVATMAYVRGRELAKTRTKDATFQIVPILVLGVVTEDGVKSVAPKAFFSALKVEEISI